MLANIVIMKEKMYIEWQFDCTVQGSNVSHSCNLSHGNENAGSLTAVPPENSYVYFYKGISCIYKNNHIPKSRSVISHGIILERLPNTNRQERN